MGRANQRGADHGSELDDLEGAGIAPSWTGGQAELRFNVAVFGGVVLAWAAITLATPKAALDPRDPAVAELAALEDAFAADRSSPELARELADRYLGLSAPQLAVAALAAATPEARQEPTVLDELARSYEATGRIDDALATAQLALTRCARALGTSDTAGFTDGPAYDCSERTYAALDAHAAALSHLQRWGVTDVHHDPRARTAYALAVRSARIVTATAD
jgi:tetratricopeptide (TPR) repeat protein